MRVAIDVTSLHDTRTGIGVVTATLLERLAARDDVDLVAYSVSWRGRGNISTLVPPGVEAATGVMAAQPLRQVWRRVDWPPIEWWTGPVDVVFGPNFVVPPARAAARVALVHDLTAWRYPELCTRDTRQYPRLVGAALRRGAHVVTPSQAVADEVVERLGAAPDRVHPVHWGTSPVTGGDAGAGRGVAGGDRYVLALGTIEPRKDHALLVRAFDAVAGDDPTLRLVVAGPDGWGVERFDAAVAAARHAGRIARVGWVDDRTRADLLAGALAFAYPSVYEGFGLPPLEAMTAGVAVVSTAVGGLPEVVGDAGLLVPAGDTDAFAGALRRVTTDADLREDLAARGVRRAATFRWDTAGDEVMAALAAARADRTIGAA